MASDYVQMDLLEWAPAEKEDPYRLAKERVARVVKIELSDEFFADKGPLKKAIHLNKGMIGIPESGKLNKIFEYADNMHVVYGSLSSGYAGLMQVYGYRMIPRDNWNDECIPVTTIKARIDEPRASHLVYTGCLVTYENDEYVLQSPVEFIRPGKEG
jgi:hypothetical protein